MAAKKELNREAKARALGFKNRYQWRKAIERGEVPAQTPAKITKRATIEKQARYYPKLKEKITGPVNPRIGADTTYDDLVRKHHARPYPVLNKEWAGDKARTTVFQYDTSDDAKIKQHRKKDGKLPSWIRAANATQERKRKWIAKNGQAAYDELYYNALVNPDKGYAATRTKGGSKDLYRWLTEVTEYLTDSEYEARYGQN